MNIDKITPAKWIDMKLTERTAAWRAISADKRAIRRLVSITLEAEKLVRRREIEARKRRPPNPPDYQVAKAILVAMIIKYGDPPPNEAALSYYLDKALETDPTDGPTMVTFLGRRMTTGLRWHFGLTLVPMMASKGATE